MSVARPAGEVAAGSVDWPGSAVGALALLACCTALSGVVSGAGWFGYLALVIVVVVGTGTALRALRVPALLAAVGEGGALACLLTAMFTRHGLVGFLPTTTAFREFREVLAQAGDQVQTGVPPVPDTREIICLSMVAIGLVAVIVDTVIVVAQAPAVAGLPLLSVVAVPAALANELLPWWSFTLAALGFALLLAVAGPHRLRSWRGGRRRPGVHAGAARAAAGLAAVSAVIGLFVGSTFTLVGTSGRVPFDDGRNANSVGVRLNPFTSLAGQLRRGRPVELFRVRGLDQNVYLKALTLADFSAKSGWSQGRIDPNGRIGAQLPLPGGLDRIPNGQVADIGIESVGYRDVWLPEFGVPLSLSGVPADSVYDPSAGVAYTRSRQKLPPYRERAIIPEPTPSELRSVPGASTALIDPQYFHFEPVDPRVGDLAIHLTAGSFTDFDRTLAINRYFTVAANGFVYSLDAGDGASNDALVNFLFTTKRGFCEQYASAMAIMLRVIGIPSRVVLGFTPGTPTGDSRMITTNDAHAWVEVYFPTIGWTTFDPTPLADGRGQQPSYVLNDGTRRPGNLPDGSTASAAPTTTKAPGRTGEPTTTTVAAAPGTGGAPAPTPPGVLVLRLIAGLACVGGAVLITVGVLRSRAAPGPRAGPWTLGRWPSTVGGPALIVCGLAVAFGQHWANPLQGWLWVLVTGALTAACCAAVPSVLRELHRAKRVRTIRLRLPGAAAAAWAELRAESQDRGASVLATETVRAAARRMAREHHLDEPGRDGLRTLLGIVEREWYGGEPPDEATGAALAAAFGAVRAALQRGAPLSAAARLWPRSVLRPGPVGTPEPVADAVV